MHDRAPSPTGVERLGEAIRSLCTEDRALNWPGAPGQQTPIGTPGGLAQPDLEPCELPDHSRLGDEHLDGYSGAKQVSLERAHMN